MEMRMATDEDRARIAALADELNPPTTSVSFTADDLARLRGGFVRVDDSDNRLYRRLCEAESRLEVREIKRASLLDHPHYSERWERGTRG